MWTRKKLLALGIPAVLIPGLYLAITLGWNPTVLTKTTDFYKNASVFPGKGTVSQVIDGDTVRLSSGVEVRLLGIDAPGRGEKGEKEAAAALADIIENKLIYLEYDRYQDDKYGRLLSWVWVGCEREPTFTPPEYMRLSNNSSREGLLINPDGCSQGILVNEEMVKQKHAIVETFKDRGELKYEKRLTR